MAREVPPTRTIHRSRRTIQRFGVHDVIVETTDHSQAMALMSDVHVTDVLPSKIMESTLEPASSTHTPQLIAAPVISYQVRQRFSEALRHHDDFGVCMFCQMIEEELELNERMVLVTEHFVGLQPFASPTPFCTHIYPRRHMASFGDISAKEIVDLGRVLRTILAKLYHGLEDPDFNLTVRTAPAEGVGVKYFTGN